MKTTLLFFFILLMATVKAVFFKPVQKIQARAHLYPSCIDRTIPNKIQPNPVKHCKLMLNDKGKLIIQPC